MSPVSGLTGSYRHMWTPLDLDLRVLQSLQLQEPNESRTREEGKARRTPPSLPLTLCIQMCAFLGFQDPAVAHSTRALSQSAWTCNPTRHELCGLKQGSPASPCLSFPVGKMETRTGYSKSCYHKRINTCQLLQRRLRIINVLLRCAVKKM